MQYKLVVLDMDGTLLDNNHQVSDKNKEAINKLKSRGINVALASGRPFESIFPYAKELEIDTPIIATNGSFVKCPVTKKVYSSTVLPTNFAKEIIEYGMENEYSISLYLNEEVHTFHERMVKVHYDLEKLHAKLIDTIDEEKDIYKIIYSHTAEKIEDAFEILHGKYNKDMYITRSDDIYLDIMHSNVSKGLAIEQLISMLKISQSEVVVMGNSYNDIAMFHVANLSIAMGNSPQEVKEAANFVSTSNDDDGVAYAIEKYIFGA